MKTLAELIAPMVKHRDRIALRLTTLHTEPSKGEDTDAKIKTMLEYEASVFTAMINRMTKQAKKSRNSAQEIVEKTAEFCQAEQNKFNPEYSSEARAQWAAYNAAYLRLTMLD